MISISLFSGIFIDSAPVFLFPWCKVWWTMATVSITNFKLTLLDNSVFTLINNLAKQHKFINLDKIYNEFIKTVVPENTSKEHVYDRINQLIIQEKIINKPNRNNDSDLANENIVDFNIDPL